MQATGHVYGTLLRESLENRAHFLKHMFSGNGMISFLGQALPGHGLAKFYSKMPATFINDATGDQVRLMTARQPHDARGHLKAPAVNKRNPHLFADRDIKRHDQKIAGSNKLCRFPQLIFVKYRQKLREGGKPVFESFRPGSVFKSTARECRHRPAGGAQPKPQHIKGAKMTDSQYDGASILTRQLQILQAFKLATRQPFCSGQPIGKTPDNVSQ
jgi:hypothetical protein